MSGAQHTLLKRGFHSFIIIILFPNKETYVSSFGVKLKTTAYIERRGDIPVRAYKPGAPFINSLRPSDAYMRR